MAAFIEGPPLSRIGLNRSVCCEVGEPEFGDSSLEAFAHLAAHFAIAGPPQVASRQRPLEKAMPSLPFTRSDDTWRVPRVQVDYTPSRPLKFLARFSDRVMQWPECG